MNGQRISELLNDMDEDLVLDAMPPLWRAGKVRPVRAARRPWAALGRIMESGWVAAILSVVVSLSVLAAIVWAGRHAPVGPGDVFTVGPGGQLSGETAGETLAETPEETPAATLPETLPWIEAPVQMVLNREIYVLETVGLFEGYVVGESVLDHEKGEGYNADGLGALYQIDELAAGLKESAVAVRSEVSSVQFGAKDTYSTVTSVTVLDPTGEVLRSVSGALLQLDEFRGMGLEGVFLVATVVTDYETPTYQKHGTYEYPVYLRFAEGEDGVTTPSLEELYNIVYGEPRIEGFGLTFEGFVEEIGADGNAVIAKMNVDFYNNTDKSQDFYLSFVMEFWENGEWVHINEGMDFPAAIWDVAPGETQRCTYVLSDIDLSRSGTYRLTADMVMGFTFDLSDP